MKTYQAKFSGQWGHFRRPEANNNPITYDFMPKTAFIGMIGAVIGLSRKVLREKYTSLSHSIFYNVQILNSISKIATSFRIYKYGGSMNTSSISNVPQFYELLRNPSFMITFFSQDEIVKEFARKLKKRESKFTPTFGLANCPINIKNFAVIDMKKVNKKNIRTKGFVPFECKPKINSDVTVSYDKIPVTQNDDWFNTEYKKVFYGYIPKNKYIEIGASNYEHQYTDGKLGYYFI